jgi:hypothetical protein
MLLLLLLASVLSATERYSTATNFSADLHGSIDTRSGTWGRAEAGYNLIRFTPPTGQRVRILRVYGDFIAWPVGRVPQGKAAGALFGLQTTAADWAKHADLANDNCFLYVQVATSGPPARAPINYKVEDGGLLETDNVLRLKFAAWLNDTGLAIHMEASLVIVYQFEVIQK